MTPVEVKTDMAEDSETKPAGRRVEAIFNEALTWHEAERAACLQRACGGDLRLQQRVEALLQAHAAPEGFFPEEPGAGPKLDPAAVHQEPLASVEKPGD